jgi:hypothetical protein
MTAGLQLWDEFFTPLIYTCSLPCNRRGTSPGTPRKVRKIPGTRLLSEREAAHAK